MRERRGNSNEQQWKLEFSVAETFQGIYNQLKWVTLNVISLIYLGLMTKIVNY